MVHTSQSEQWGPVKSDSRGTLRIPGNRCRAFVRARAHISSPIAKGTISPKDTYFTEKGLEVFFGIVADKRERAI